MQNLCASNLGLGNKNRFKIFVFYFPLNLIGQCSQPFHIFLKIASTFRLEKSLKLNTSENAINLILSSMHLCQVNALPF